MIGAHGHGQWVDDDIFGGDTQLGGALYGGGRDTVIIHAQANRGRAVFFGQGDKTAFRDFSSPLTELIKAFPLYSLRAAYRAFELAVSMHRGTSTSDITVCITCASKTGSSAPGTPALTSITATPALTCELASRRTISKFPSRKAAKTALRPVDFYAFGFVGEFSC